MSKEEFFKEMLAVIQSKVIHHHGIEEMPASFSLKGIAYYEWSEPEAKWLKIDESYPDPDESWPTGQFDGEILEIQLSI